MAIYTKKGDKGKTSTLGVGLVSKSSKIIDALGEVDELNSFLGIVGGLNEVQRTLFTINAILAGSNISFPVSKTQELEKKIDKLEEKLPVIGNFIIYGGGKKASLLYYARALCRRAERSLVSTQIPKFRFQILAYMNRLSDYLFMLARSSGRDKINLWQPPSRENRKQK